MTNQLFAQRVSPSGPLLGSPAALVGSGQIDGRCWRAQGAGQGPPIAIPVVSGPPDTWAAVPGLDMVPVDFRPGYGYDLSVDVVAWARPEDLVQRYQVIPLMSLDGLTWVPFGGRVVNCFDVRADGRLHQIYVPQDFPNWKFARVVLTDVTSPVIGDLVYMPDFAVLAIQEFTTS